MKKLSLLFAMLTMVVSGAWAKDGVTVISFSNTSTSISGYGITDGIQYTEGADAPAKTTITTTSGATATLTISSGKIWTNSIAGTWSNTYAIEDINTELATTLTVDQFSTNSALKLASSAAGGSKVSVAVTLPTEDAGKKITLYAVMGAREVALDNISVTGITGATYSYATNTGSEFSSEAAYSAGALNPTIVKITGTTTGSFTVTSSTNKSAIALLAYKLTSDLDALKTAVKAELAKIGTPVIDERTALETKLAAAEAGTATYDELNSAYSAYTTAVASSTVNTLYLPTGYYKMKSMATDRTKLYLYNNYLKTTGYNGITLQSADAVTTNNGIWKITNNSTSVAIVNGEGTKLVRGNQNATTVTSASNVTAMSSLTFGDYNNTYYTSKGGIYFTEGLNCSNQGYTVTIDETATNFLTTWAGYASAADDRWTFEAVNTTDIYTVSITQPENTATVYVTRKSTGEIALNGGFFIGEVTASDLSCSIDGYATYYDINTTDKTITVTFVATGYYRLKNVSQNAYLTNVTQSQNWNSLALVSDPTSSTIYQLTSESYFINFEKNTYLKNPWTLQTEKPAAAWSISAGTKDGTYSLQYVDDSSNTHYIYGAGATWVGWTDTQSETTDWTLEAVETPSMTESRTTALGSYGTICLPYDATATGATILACQGKNSDEKIVFEYATGDKDEDSYELKAGVPYLYRATADAQTFTTTGTTYAEAGTAEATEGWKGSYTEEELAKDACILKGGKFYTVALGTGLTTTNIYVGAYRAYVTKWADLTPITEARANSVLISLDGGSTTGINGIVDATATAKDGKFVENGKVVIVNNGKKYNVAGQEVK